MKLIDTGYDELLSSNYELYSVKYKDLQEMVKSWYPNINFREFDEKYIRDENSILESKQSGLVCNLFFAYKEDDKFYLLDGFNRLLTNYCMVDINLNVYIKIIIDKLPDDKLMGVMFKLNNWKLYSSDTTGYRYHFLDSFLDRGFKLFLYVKFGIEFYYNEKEADKEKKDYKRDYYNRKYDKDDINVIDFYFKNESDFSGDFYYTYYGIKLILTHVNFINDIKDIIQSNKYKEPPFKNFDMFLSSYIMYLSYRRTNLKDENEHKFDTYISLLKEDKKFFKKLQGMCGNESTRKNLYTWFRNLK
jgi:hypothetical protein